MILVVSLLQMVEDDKLIWGEESGEIYLVRSRYRKLMKERRRGNGPREEEDWGSL
jgi:hypothetical protein